MPFLRAVGHIVVQVASKMLDFLFKNFGIFKTIQKLSKIVFWNLQSDFWAQKSILK